MSIVINTNTQSLFAQRALGNNTMKLQKSVEKLSTGFRINRAGDDAAGLSISEKLTAEIRGLQKAKQNAGDGISLLQTAEGALGVIQDNLQRIRELFVQAVNGTNGENEKAAIQREINERITTIQDIADATKFNGQKLLDGSGDFKLQTGANNAETFTLSFKSDVATSTGIDIDITEEVGGNDDEGHLIEGSVSVGFALDELSVGSTTVASHDTNVNAVTTNGLTVIDVMLDNLSRMRSSLGAAQNSLESRIEYLDVAVENASASRSRIKDVDVAQESSNLVKQQILQQSAGAMLTQANSTPQLALNLLP